MRAAIPGFALLLAACAGASSSGPAVEGPACSSQFDCDHGKEYGIACVAGFCGEKLPSVDTLSDLKIGVQNTQIKLKGVQAFRAFVIYPTRPNGDQVTCANVGDLAKLKDPTQTNLTAYPIETNVRTQGDVIVYAVHISGPGRIVYVEVYKDPINSAVAGEEGPAIGRGCLADAPYTPDEGAKPTIILDMAP